MKETPILFSAEMVRAILDGRKNMTRRVIKPQPPEYCDYFAIRGDEPERFRGYMRPGEPTDFLLPKYPYGQPGDRLWVRETWQELNIGFYKVVAYKAGCNNDTFDFVHPNNTIEKIKVNTWRPSIHMPKEAARIWLEIDEIRVERVQDITENDAEWEGVGGCPYEHRVCNAYGYGHDSTCWAEGDCLNPNKACSKSLREHFRELWDSINAKRGFGWDVNPWVWVIEFHRIFPE